MENQRLLLPGAFVVADNVLKPGAALFLWRLIKSSAYDVEIVCLKEFAMHSKDWMSISVLKSQCEDDTFCVVPRPPKELFQLEKEADGMRAQATGVGGVESEKWAAFAEDMEARLELYGIASTHTYGVRDGSFHNHIR